MQLSLTNPALWAQKRLSMNYLAWIVVGILVLNAVLMLLARKQVTALGKELELNNGIPPAVTLTLLMLFGVFIIRVDIRKK
jgi:CBS domain containing-hemolysin-like protein